MALNDLKSHLSYVKTSVACYILSYFIKDHTLCLSCLVQCFITFKMPQGRSRSRIFTLVTGILVLPLVS